MRKPAVDYSDAELDLLLATNLKSAFALCQACHPMLKAGAAAAAAASGGGGDNGGGAASSSVLFNSSVAGGPTAMRSGAPYGLTKAALNQMARSLAVEWAADGIRVNSVAPWCVFGVCVCVCVCGCCGRGRVWRRRLAVWPR